MSSTSTTTTAPSPMSSFSVESCHKWTSFEVRTLISLIIKGEHRVSKDPTYLTDRLNGIVNPARTTTITTINDLGTTNTKTVTAHDDGREIRHAEVQKMIHTIMAKKKHAVDISERHPTNVLTRKKMRAFVRTPSSSSSAAAAALVGAGYAAKKGHEKMVQERKRIKKAMRNPRERNLLLNWGMTPSFFDGKY